MKTTIKLFLMDGAATGRIKCSFSSSWIGLAYKIPVSEIDKCSIPEFYPVKIHVFVGILGKEDVEIKINDIDKLKNVFSQIVNSEKVRMLIMKTKRKQ